MVSTVDLNLSVVVVFNHGVKRLNLLLVTILCQPTEDFVHALKTVTINLQKHWQHTSSYHHVRRGYATRELILSRRDSTNTTQCQSSQENLCTERPRFVCNMQHTLVIWNKKPSSQPKICSQKVEPNKSSDSCLLCTSGSIEASNFVESDQNNKFAGTVNKSQGLWASHFDQEAKEHTANKQKFLIQTTQLQLKESRNVFEAGATVLLEGRGTVRCLNEWKCPIPR